MTEPTLALPTVPELSPELLQLLAADRADLNAVCAAYQPADGLNVDLYHAYMVIAAIGTVFAAGYLLWMFQRTAFGLPKAEFEHAHIPDVHGPEWLAWTPLLILIVALGIFPSLLFEVTDGAVQQVTAAFAQVTGN